MAVNRLSGFFAKFSIKGKLLSAFVAVCILTVTASAATIISYRLISKLDQIEASGLPGLTHAMLLSQQAQELSASLAFLASSETVDELRERGTELTQRRAVIQQRLAELAQSGMDDTQVEKLQQTIAE